MRLDGVEGVQGEVGVEEVRVAPAPHGGEAIGDPGVYDDAHDPPLHALLGGPGQRTRYDRVAVVAPGSAELIRDSGKKRLAWTTSLSAASSSP